MPDEVKMEYLERQIREVKNKYENLNDILVLTPFLSVTVVLFFLAPLELLVPWLAFLVIIFSIYFDKTAKRE